MSYVRAVNNKSENLIIASENHNKIVRWKKGLDGFPNLFYIDCLSLLRNELVRIKPEFLLLDHDLPGLNGVHDVAGLRKLCPQTKIVLLNGAASDEEEWLMFRAGVRGCCSSNIEPSVLKILVQAIQKGELWIRRTLVHRLLEQQENEPLENDDASREGLCQLENLTQREYEIALRVGSGDSNKEIAQSLDITERTVKAHLTGVFRKLGVTDRLKVAVILWGNASKTTMSSGIHAQRR